MAIQQANGLRDDPPSDVPIVPGVPARLIRDRCLTTDQRLAVLEGRVALVDRQLKRVDGALRLIRDDLDRASGRLDGVAMRLCAIVTVLVGLALVTGAGAAVALRFAGVW